MKNGSRRGRLKDVVAPALLVVLPLCLFGPYTIFSGNEAEFSAPFWTLIRPLLATGAAIALALIGIGLILPSRVFRSYVVLLFSLGLVIWIQGNLLVADYGAFTGVAIDWTVESWRNPYEIAMWVAVPVLGVAASKYIGGIAPFASGVLVTLQAAALMLSVVHADPSSTIQAQGPSDAMFELSRTRNVLHIVLDAFQSDVFGEILAEERARADRSLSGAVFFANHTGAFPTTIASIPAMLTGKVYRNDQPLQRYMRDILKETSIFKSLRANGYRADAATGMYHGRESATNFFRLQRPYVSYDEYVRFTAWQLADLSLFRHAPHILRPLIHNDESWRLQAMFGPGDTRTRQHHSVNGAFVLSEFARKLTPAVDEPVSKYIHVGIPHRPIVVNGNCDFIGVARSTRASFKEQARCAFRRTADILDRLQSTGVYDKTFIVISSDHGIGLPSPRFANDRQTPMGSIARIAGHAMALLVVKPLNSQGPVRVSQAPTTITDIPATILDGIGAKPDLPGESALKRPEDAPRTRQWAFYDWEHDDWRSNYFDTLDVIHVNGPVLDGKSWTLQNTIYKPAADEALRTRGLYETHRSRAGVEYRWSMPHVFLHVPGGARSIEMKIRSVAPKPQTVTVSAGDQVLGSITLADQSWATLKYPLPAARNPSADWVHLHADPPWRAPGSARPLGVQTRDVIFSP